MNKIGIIINPEKDPGLINLRLVIDILNENNYDCVVSCCDYPSDEPFSFSNPEECFDGASLVLTLGGDGTLLRAAAYAIRYNIPLLGINFGHLGFLAELEPDEIKQLPGILSHGYEYTDRMMLRVSIWHNDSLVAESVALNDAVIRSKNGKPAHITISDQNDDLLDYFCDGFIVATPTGSTAYSMSAGGPILEPCSDNIVVTPICPHTLGARSVVFGSLQEKINVRVTNADRIYPILECDGAEIGSLAEGDHVSVSRYEKPLRLVKLKNKSFYKVLNEKISRRML